MNVSTSNSILKWIGSIFLIAVAVAILQHPFKRWMESIPPSYSYSKPPKPRIQEVMTPWQPVTRYAWSEPFMAMPSFDLYSKDKSVWLYVSADGGKTYQVIPGGNTKEMEDERRAFLALLNLYTGDPVVFRVRTPGPSITDIRFSYKITNDIPE